MLAKTHLRAALMKHTTLTFLLLFAACNGDSISPDDTDTDTDTNPHELIASQLEVTTVEGIVYSSSSKLSLTWDTPSKTVDHFEVTATESLQNTTDTFTIDQSLSSTTLTGLKASTSYTIDIKACTDSSCTETTGTYEATSATTSEEYWQIQGTGNAYDTATIILEGSITAPYTVHYGSEAGSSLEGKVRLYCNPFLITFQNLGVDMKPG